MLIQRDKRNTSSSWLGSSYLTQLGYDESAPGNIILLPDGDTTRFLLDDAANAQLICAESFIINDKELC